MKALLFSLCCLVLASEPIHSQPQYFGGSCIESITGLSGTYEYGYCVTPPLDYPTVKNTGQDVKDFESAMNQGIFAALESAQDPIVAYTTAKDYFKTAKDEAVRIDNESVRIKAYDAATRGYIAANAALWEQKNGRDGYKIFVKISGLRSTFD